MRLIFSLLYSIPEYTESLDGRKMNVYYYIILGSGGETIKEILRKFVAQQVEIEAHMVQVDDWIVMYVDSRKDIKRYSYLQSEYKSEIQSCIPTP
jgi:hypothetical protein